MDRFTPVACPACFTNVGFRHTLERFVHEHSGNCPNCGLEGQLKLNRGSLQDAIGVFFVDGSHVSETYAPVYQVNDSNPHPATFDPTLSSDAALACGLTGLVVFHYGPPLWRLGLTEHYDEFKAGGERREAAAKTIVASARSMEISPATSFFRVRLNAKEDESISTAVAFDPPPESVVRDPGRWDEPGHPVLYVSDDIELCLHECRTTIADEIIVATLQPVRKLRVLDLSERIECKPNTPFDDPNIFVGIMSRSRGVWLDYGRAISRAARAAGYDGIRYVSYYSQAKHDANSLNLAIFGRPIESELLKIHSVNRLRLTDMSYAFQFGPVLYKDSAMAAELARMKTRWQEIADDLEQETGVDFR